MARDAGSVHKFRALAWLDEFFGVADPDERNRRYDAAMARLDEDTFDVTGPTVARVEELPTKGSSDGDDPLGHLRAHWLSDVYWPSIPAAKVEAALRDGFREAIRDARASNLPLNSVWVCATDDSKADVFRVDHVVGPTAVIVVIVTPRPSGRT